ncbi:MAG TPA: NAD(P)H-dependent oxidoreductase subunit E, partial [Longimicrobiales bacterium]|nr:NAD(P)H-dependent oxidoreductase subunit E [Longimicrobiales bacterium]
MAKRGTRAGSGKRLRPAPKGRGVDPRAHEDVVALLADQPRRRDLLIEHLHTLQDHFGQLSVAHLTALAWELRLTPAEVFEVASFYHHFDIVKDRADAPPVVTVRVCESIACHLAGSQELLRVLQARLGNDVRVVPAPCVGR